MGSLRYAVSHGREEHVEGVGKKHGNRLIIILDPEPEVLERTKEIMLESSPELKELTRAEETILLLKYNPVIRIVEFI